MTNSMRALGTSVLCLGLLLACASGQQKASDASDSSSSSSSSNENTQLSLPHPEREGSSTAVANTCADRPCISNSDCCGSTSCGFDPERSHVQRYCLGI
jgi:hypothetical protein